MNVFDISWPLHIITTGYKDRKIIKFEARKTFEIDGYRESTITIDAHSGTHVDAPSHFLGDGKTIDQVSLASIFGDCKVLDLTHVQEKITGEDLGAHEIKQHDIVLFKTSNSARAPHDPFNPNFVYLAISGAQYLKEKGVKAVGIDYLGIERNQPGHATHKELMQHDIVIIEGLRLGHVKAGSYFMCCLPLAVIGLEAAPARAVLIEK